MFPTHITTKRPVTISMIILTLVILGTICCMKIPVDLMPEDESTSLTIRSELIGASSEEMETSVVEPLEEQLKDTRGLKNITSYIREGTAYTILEFNHGTDPDPVAADVNGKIDAILYRLPSNLRKPLISKFDVNDPPVMNLAVTGTVAPEELRFITDKQIKSRLTSISGVASVEMVGGREREIHVDLLKKRLDGLNISLEKVAAIIASQTASISGGRVSNGKKECTVRVLGRFSDIDQIRTIGIPVKDGNRETRVPLYTIANVSDSYKEVRELAEFNGKSVVGLSIRKLPGVNTVSISQMLLKTIDSLNKELPPGITINIADENSVFIKSIIDDVKKYLVAGTVIMLFILLLFLGWRTAITMAVVLPVFLMISFLGLQAFHQTLNLITLSVLMIFSVTLIFNTIMIIAEIVRRADEQLSISDKVTASVKAVMNAGIATVLTNSAFFTILAITSGMGGVVFKSFFAFILTTGIIAFLVTFTLVPLLTSRMVFPKKLFVDYRRFFSGIPLCNVSLCREKILKFCINNKFIIILAVVIAFSAVFLGIEHKFRIKYLPDIDDGIISISLELPPGTPIDETGKELKLIEKKLISIPEIDGIYSIVGGGGINVGVNRSKVIIRLKKETERYRTTKEVAEAIRPLLTSIPDAIIIVKQKNPYGKENESDINMEITGKNMKEILETADTVKSIAEKIPGLIDCRLSYMKAPPELSLIPNRQMLDEYGTDMTSLGSNLRNSISGVEIAFLHDKTDDLPIKIHYAQDDCKTIDDVSNISTQTEKGMIPVKILCEEKQDAAVGSIQRRNCRRFVTILADVSDGDAQSKISSLTSNIDHLKVESECNISIFNQHKSKPNHFYLLTIILFFVLILPYMIIAASTESLTIPIPILITVALGLTGVFLTLFVFGHAVSMFTYIAIILIIGIIVNTTVWMMSYIQYLRNDGRNKKNAVVNSCNVKSNSILIMNFATIFALLPMALANKCVLSSFAAALISGIIVSSIITLFVFPALYMFSIGGKKE